MECATHAAEPVDIEDIFDRVQPDALRCEGWEAVADSECEGVRLWSLETSSGISLLRSKCELDLLLDDALRVCRPELLMHPSRPECDEVLFGCGVERDLAPGDALAWFRYNYTPVLLSQLSLVGTAEIRVESRELYRTGQGHPEDREGTPAGATQLQRIRIAVRRDFPQLGQHSFVMVPRMPHTGELVEEWGMFKAIAVLLEAAEGKPATVVTEVKQLINVPKFALPKTAEFVLWRYDWLTRCGTLPSCRDAIDGPSSFLIIGMKHCTRGPPLLPVEGCGVISAANKEDWVPKQISGKGNGLAEYLRSFLSRAGVEDVMLWDTLDGRRLVPYQAVVRREAWARAWATLEKPYKEQRAAYRRTFGGKCAPDLAWGRVEPRFVPLDGDSGPLPPGLPAPSAPSTRARLRRVPVANTFVHFGPVDPPPGLPRCASGSKLELSHPSPLLAC